MPSFKLLAPFFLIYALGILATAGHFYRKHEGRLGARQTLCVLFWPAWWFLEHSVRETIDVISDATIGTDERATLSFGVGLFAAGQFLFSNWEMCSGLTCTGVLLKSSAMLFPPVGAMYLTWLIAQLA
ncbi:hypothetical protein ACVIHI_004010 [Bradyrhizobium sp. USDA 4524]|uniref:hypothetical protein n=1 Tax=unclassified Bradyrhizobium TaxID=2631580 RepID=UPI0020A002F8|nr:MULTISPECIES: hypothetical protein [unclassified Bradyrhizobium]MCP1843070.1 hypothetical protein [Bradyrhizobium sp. USDA 4538]MCP1850637.1 hypothetical protein [Bradyrhizobium sp. USDA 4541]MCP1903636.1 hypothetical protein [Bradyrhizobium sp. USDA 4537]MCP1990707.1 hypothetical protein [Bradyrhizobium sp. USDA 4539]